MTWDEAFEGAEGAEPYTIIRIRKKGPVRYVVSDAGVLCVAPPGTFYFAVFYVTYSKRAWLSVHGRDELEAFMKATEKLTKRKARADRRRARKATSTS